MPSCSTKFRLLNNGFPYIREPFVSYNVKQVWTRHEGWEKKA